jgi:hypothetical protein
MLARVLVVIGAILLIGSIAVSPLYLFFTCINPLLEDGFTELMFPY